jgi:hypothetical protein
MAAVLPTMDIHQPKCRVHSRRSRTMGHRRQVSFRPNVNSHPGFVVLYASRSLHHNCVGALMLHILTITAWIIAFGCWVYLVSQAFTPRLFHRGQKKVTVRRFFGFRKPRDFDENHQASRQSLDDAAPPKADDGRISVGRRRAITLFGFLMLFLWEAYWVSEIAERFSNSTNPLQLPYFFLLVVMVGLPLTVFQFSRWVRRRSVH